MTIKRSVFFINEKKASASSELSHLLKKCIEKVDHPWKEIIILCIGSDRITGDSLGPLIGHRLSKYRWKNIHIYGTLDYPVHALNLEQTVICLKKRHPSALIIAVDASLGSKKHVGFITVGTGPILPGAGVHKSLPLVGDLFITGILNASGTFEHLMLQTTRLSLVVQMAETISDGIEKTFAQPHENRRLLPEEWFQPDDTRCLCWAKDSGMAALSIESISGTSC
ncbi:MAG: spore protease YyaC [Clostridia bacterium]|nr:spore protease YyaC [Clostridia bacterium]NCC42405.1 spore protease YyaC [Clostridia bacterium]